MSKALNTVLNHCVDLVTRLEIIDHAPCKVCNGTGRMGADTALACTECGGKEFVGDSYNDCVHAIPNSLSSLITAVLGLSSIIV